MKPGRFFWKLFAGNLILLAAILGVSVWVIVNAMERAYIGDVTAQLQATASHIRNIVLNRNLYQPDGRAALQALADDIGGMETALRRITIIAANGEVWADSDAQPAQMESHADRPEVIEAMKTGYGRSQRRSETVQRELVYVAYRVDRPTANDTIETLGVIRVATPVFRIAEQTGAMRQLIWRVGGIGLLASSIIALGLAYIWSMPIRRITEAARSLSQGDLSARTEVRGSDEIAQMATSLNQMRASLANQLHTIDQQRHNLEYFIQTLSEGVIIADAGGRIMLINQAACRLLGPAAGNDAKSDAPNIHGFVGRYVNECVPHAELCDLLLRGIAGNTTHEDGGTGVQELPLHVEKDGGVIHLLARASDIDIDDGKANVAASSLGRLVVLTDVTELTRTIRMKTDFVANASHELRTPISTIRASVETLQQIDLTVDGESAQHFMEVIERHTWRLEELVSDLLDLSRLESGSSSFPVERVSFVDVMDELYGRFGHTLKQKGLLWKSSPPQDSETIRVNGRLLRLVLDNLVSNAIKFTDEGGGVRVLCANSGADILISVSDDGCGIPADDQQRVFERFYQVEAARSDTAKIVGVKRGTGLGLSIVRHAVAAMNAAVELKSEPGVGTTVMVRIPNAAA